MNRLHHAIPIRREHSLRVNARIVAWAAAQGATWILAAPVLLLLAVLMVPAALWMGVERVARAVSDLEHAARLRKWGVHNDDLRRRVCEWVGRLNPLAECVAVAPPSPTDLRRGFDIGDGIKVQWWFGPDVMLLPGRHKAPLFDDAAFHAAVEKAEASRVEWLESIGHAPHCARRQVWGDGECECDGDHEWIRGDTMARAARAMSGDAEGGV